MRITRGRFLSLVLAVLGQTPVYAQAAEKLNVLLIISDDLRPELGCYGSPLGKTPHIDALAAAGVRFDRAYCQFPLCNPSRSSMLNSRIPAHTGVLGNRAYFRDAHPDWVTLPQLFKQNGYAALRTGKIFHGGIDDLPSWTEGGDARRNIGEGAQRLLDPDELMLIQNPPRKKKAGSDDSQLTRAQRSDRWLVLEGDGEAHGDYHCAD